MGPAGYLLAILGCGESDAPCQQVQIAPARYESQAQCLADQDAALLRFQGQDDFPVVVAECRPANQRVATLQANEVRLPKPSRTNLRTASAERR